MSTLATASRYGRTFWFSLRVWHRSPNRESDQQTLGGQQVWLEVNRFFPSPKPVSVPTSWLDFLAPSELIPQVDPGLNPNEVAVTAPSRGNYTTLSRGNKKTLHLVMYCQRHRAKVRMRVRRDDMWMRSCAVCKALLRKLRLRDSVRCQCGWTW